MHADILHQIILLLAAAVAGVGLFRGLALPPILAYLLIGVLVGPHALGWIQDTEDTRFLAEFGVVFLLFTIGLEFSIPQLLAMKRVVFGLGAVQVGLTTAVVALGSWWLGLTPAAAFVVGGALAVSSTAIVIRQLAEQMELGAHHGRLAVGILLFQDLVVVPFLIVIPTLGGGAETSVALPLLWALVKGAGAFALLMFIGHRLLRPAFYWVARARSAELFTLSVLLVSLAAAGFTHWIGLSLALGAFHAGIMLGETEFRHQVESDIRPFRDVLLGLFFISIGMLLDLGAIAGIWHWVLLLTLGIVLGKTLLILLLSRLFGADPDVALRTGLVLAQGGEFGFVLLTLGRGEGLLSPATFDLVSAAAILSMALTPILVRYNGPVAGGLFSLSFERGRRRIETEVAAGAEDLAGHVIICGFGRVGQNLARFLDREGFPYVALDLDPRRVREARLAGDRVVYGDATRPELLRAAGLERARVVVVSYHDAVVALHVLHHVRAQRPEMPVLVRTTDDSALGRLQEAGATEVIPEILEGSLMLISHTLALLGVSPRRILRGIREVREDRYSLLREYFPGERARFVGPTREGRERLHSVTLERGARANGRRLGELGLDAGAVSVTALSRGGVRCLSPDPDTELGEGDILVLYGNPEALEQAEERLLRG